MWMMKRFLSSAKQTGESRFNVLLPKRTYDHVSVKLLNGNVLVEELTAKDVYTNQRMGRLRLKNCNYVRN